MTVLSKGFLSISNLLTFWDKKRNRVGEGRERERVREINELLHIINDLVLKIFMTCYMSLNKLFNSSVYNSRNENTDIVPKRVLYRLSKRIAQTLPTSPARFTSTWPSCISPGHFPNAMQPATLGQTP